MKIKSIAIKNFRSFKNTEVDFDDYTAFVGPNGAGKSTVLCALNIFFRLTEEAPTNLTELEAEDFHNGNTKEPIEITVTFHDLEEQAQKDFVEYYRGGLLLVSSVAKFNETTQALQPHVSEMFFTPRLVLVEGLEDVAYITAWMTHTGRWDEFRKSGCHIVAVNGKNHLCEPIVIAKELGIPTFVIFDADGNTTNANNRNKHQIDNVMILKLLGGDPTTPFPTTPVWTDKFVVWPANLGSTLKVEVGSAVWDPAYTSATKGLGNPEGSFAKNTIHIAEHLALLKAHNANLPTLDRICNAVIELA